VAKPELAQDARLMAHEAAHLLQQRGGATLRVETPSTGELEARSRARGDLEAEAEAVVSAFLGGKADEGLQLSATSQRWLYQNAAPSEKESPESEKKGSTSEAAQAPQQLSNSADESGVEGALLAGAEPDEWQRYHKGLEARYQHRLQELDQAVENWENQGVAAATWIEWMAKLLAAHKDCQTAMERDLHTYQARFAAKYVELAQGGKSRAELFSLYLDLESELDESLCRHRPLGVSVYANALSPEMAIHFRAEIEGDLGAAWSELERIVASAIAQVQEMGFNAAWQQEVSVELDSHCSALSKLGMQWLEALQEARTAEDLRVLVQRRESELEPMRVQWDALVPHWTQLRLQREVESLEAGLIEAEQTDEARLRGEDESGAKGLFKTPGEVEAARVLWLARLEAAWQVDAEAVSNWAMGNQPGDGTKLSGEQRILAKTGMVKPTDPDTPQDKKRYTSLEMRKAVVEKATEFSMVSRLLLQGALEGKRRFELMRRAMREPELNPGQRRTPGDLKISGAISAYRSLTEQVTKWNGQVGKSGTLDPDAAPRETEAVERAQQNVISKDGRAAPTTSRHGWGTEYDIGSTNSGDFKEGGDYSPHFLWLQENAWKYGFFRPYGDPSRINWTTAAEEGQKRVAVKEEEWHWSYYPVSQAFWELLRRHWTEHEVRVRAVLEERYPSEMVQVPDRDLPPPDGESKPRMISVPKTNANGERFRDKRISWVENHLYMLHEGVHRELEAQP
jgi:hypothetical protein